MKSNCYRSKWKKRRKTEEMSVLEQLRETDRKCIPFHLNRDINWNVPNAIDRFAAIVCFNIFFYCRKYVSTHESYITSNSRDEIEWKKHVVAMRPTILYCMENERSSIDLCGYFECERSLWQTISWKPIWHFIFCEKTE